MHSKKIKKVFFLFLYTILFFMIIITKTYNVISYVFLLLLLSLMIFYINDFNLVTSNTLFLIYYIYTVAAGPIILLSNGIQYNFDYFTLIIGGLLAFGWGNAILNNKKEYKKKLRIKKIKILVSRKYPLRILYILSIFITVIYVLKNRSVLFGGKLDAGRVQAMSGSGILLFLSQLSVLVVPMLYDLYFHGKKQDSKTISKYEVIGLTILASFLLLVSGFRSPIMTLFICLSVLIIQKNKINNKKIFILGICMIFMVEVLGIIRSNLSGVAIGIGSFYKSLSTALVVNSINLNYIFSACPTVFPFQHGYTYLINLFMLKPGPDLDFTLWLKNQLNLDFIGGGVTPTILGEFYINFNIIGIYIGMFLFGILGTLIYRYFIRNNKSFLGVYFIWQFAHSASGGISNVYLFVIFYTIIYYILLMFPEDLGGGKYINE